MSGFACYQLGCQSPVIGQCAGYKQACGRFYCAAHSQERFCAECAKRRADDQAEATRQRELEIIYQDYIAAAKTIKEPGCLAKLVQDILVLCFGFLVLYGVIFMGAALFGSGGTSDGRILIAVLAAFGLGIGILGVKVTAGRAKRRSELVAQQIKEISDRKPGFEQFYLAWKQNKEAETKALATTIGLSALLGTAGLAKAAYDDLQKEQKRLEAEQVRRDIHDVAEAARSVKRVIDG